MKHFAIILKQEHTEVCMLRPNIVIMAGNCGNGTISIDISGSDENGSSVYFLLDCGDFKGRYIEDYDKETQKEILDNIETAVARDIASFAERGFTFLGADRTKGECFECFYLEDHKVQWQKDYIGTLQVFQQEAANQTHNRQ